MDNASRERKGVMCSSPKVAGEMEMRRRWARTVDVEGVLVVPGLGEDLQEMRRGAGRALAWSTLSIPASNGGAVRMATPASSERGRAAVLHTKIKWKGSEVRHVAENKEEEVRDAGVVEVHRKARNTAAETTTLACNSGGLEA